MEGSTICGVAGSAVGGAVAGPPGAVVGGIIGRLVAPLLDVDSLLAEIEGGFTGDALKTLGASGWRYGRRKWDERRLAQTVQQVNGDLLRAFRDAVQRALYDIGGANCFPDRWKPLRDVPAEAVYPQTPQGHALWQRSDPLVAQFCECLQALDNAIDGQELFPVQPPAVQPDAGIERYLEATTPHELNEAFFAQIILPFLGSFRLLLREEPAFERHLRRFLLDRTLVHLRELLKQRPESWRAFNRLMLDGIRDSVRELGAGQSAILQKLGADQGATHQGLDALSERIDKLDSTEATSALADLLAAWGAAEKRIDDRFDDLVQRVRDQHGDLVQRLETMLGSLTRIEKVVTETRDDVQATREAVEEIARQIRPVDLRARYAIPDPIDGFVGRGEQIEQLVDQLRRSSTTGTAALICGLGGLGKTQLACAVAQRLRDDFPDGQLMLELRGASEHGRQPVTTEEALRTCIVALGGEAQGLPEDVAQLAALYTSLLQGKRVLILADDAEDAAQTKRLMPPRGCALLITSRRRFLLPGMPNPERMPPLTEHEAETLVLTICDRISRVEAERLAKLCGYLPLALRISASLLAGSTRSAGRYLDDLERRRLRLLSDPQAEPGDPDYKDASVQASLDLSYEDLDSAAQSVLRQLGVFAAGFDRTAAEAIVSLPDMPDGTTLDDLMDRLYHYSLLDQDAATERFSLHDLVRFFALDRLRDVGEEESARLRYAAFYTTLAYAADRLYLKGGENIGQALALFDGERAHIGATWQWLSAQAPSEPVDKLLIDFVDATVYIGDLRFAIRMERIPQIEAALVAAQRQHERAATGHLLGDLGTAYADLGETRRAIECFEQQLAIAREIGDRRVEGNALGSLGVAYRNLGETRRAIEHHEQQLAIVRDAGDRRVEGNALGSLGVAYKNLGEMRRAIEYHEQALLIHREVGDRRGEGDALNSLGVAYKNLGETRRAIEYHEQQLAIVRGIGDRRGEGAGLGNLGVAYASLGETRRAIEYYEQQLAIVREIGDRLGQGIALGNLGLANEDLGEMRRAIAYHEQRIAIAREIGDRRGEGNALNNLGVAYADLDDVERALSYAEQAFEILMQIESPNTERARWLVEQLRQRLAGSSDGEG